MGQSLDKNKELDIEYMVTPMWHSKVLINDNMSDNLKFGYCY
jgi:hypothetical protein